MLTVKNAWHRRGYSAKDHFLEDQELEPMIGLQFQTVAEARTRAEELSKGTNGTANVPIGLEVAFEDGTTHVF